LDLDSSEAWIANLQVAASYRSQGLGRELVQVAQAIAGAMGIPVVNVFPLPSSLDFWRKMGYTPTPCMTRVLRRDLSVGGNSAGWGNEHLDDHRETVARQEIIAS